MSIASPKLSPVILATNNNGKNQTTKKKEVNNNNNTSRTSNGNDSKLSINHKTESLRQIHILHTSDESDDDKPLAKKAAALNGQNSASSNTIKKELITVKKEPSLPKRKNASIDSDDDLPLVGLFS